MTTTHSNRRPACSTCPQTTRSINGIYCRLLRRYVEYATKPPCTASRIDHITS